jgi:Tol biopolymer transport system component
MKNSRLLLLILLLICNFFVFSQVKTSQLTNIKIVAQGDNYSLPRWSPSGDKLMFTSSHNNKGIYIVDLKTKAVNKISDSPNIGYNASWSENGEYIDFQEKKVNQEDNSTYYQTNEINIATGKIIEAKTIASKLLTISKNNLKGEPTTPAITVYIDDNLKIVAQRGFETWIVTREEGQYYHPLISPDGTKVAVHNGSKIYVYDLRKEAAIGQKVGSGLASGWSPDSKSIITFEDESSDGHEIIGSELYEVSTVSGKKTQLTYSKDIIEMWPNISPDGKKVAFADEKTGSIYVADLNNN